ncbi:hypothetical protein ACET9H_20915 [Aeromonas media]|uniref:hypothetical protein n=1 Tax=Aeromonas media TaxID=651 RepID=UPI0038D193CB
MTEKPNLATATGNLLHIFPELEDESNQHPWLKVLFPISMINPKALLASLKKAGFVDYIKASLKTDDVMQKPSYQSNTRYASKELIDIIEANKDEVFDYYAFRGEYWHAGRCVKVRSHFIQWTNPLKKEKDLDIKMAKLKKVIKLKQKNTLVSMFDTQVGIMKNSGIKHDEQSLREIFDMLLCSGYAHGVNSTQIGELAYTLRVYTKCLDMINAPRNSIFL